MVLNIIVNWFWQIIIFFAWVCLCVAVMNKVQIGLDQKLSMPEVIYWVLYLISWNSVFVSSKPTIKYALFLVDRPQSPDLAPNVLYFSLYVYFSIRLNRCEKFHAAIANCNCLQMLLLIVCVRCTSKCNYVYCITEIKIVLKSIRASDLLVMYGTFK